MGAYDNPYARKWMKKYGGGAKGYGKKKAGGPRLSEAYRYQSEAVRLEEEARADNQKWRRNWQDTAEQGRKGGSMKKKYKKRGRDGGADRWASTNYAYTPEAQAWYRDRYSSNQLKSSKKPTLKSSNKPMDPTDWMPPMGSASYYMPQTRYAEPTRAASSGGGGGYGGYGGYRRWGGGGGGGGGYKKPVMVTQMYKDQPEIYARRAEQQPEYARYGGRAQERMRSLQRLTRFRIG